MKLLLISSNMGIKKPKVQKKGKKKKNSIIFIRIGYFNFSEVPIQEYKINL